jgi:hypothetical protein
MAQLAVGAVRVFPEFFEIQFSFWSLRIAGQ